MVRAFLPRMLEMDKGSVVSLCSIAGQAGAPHMVPYREATLKWHRTNWFEFTFFERTLFYAHAFYAHGLLSARIKKNSIFLAYVARVHVF